MDWKVGATASPWAPAVPGCRPHQHQATDPSQRPSVARADLSQIYLLRSAGQFASACLMLAALFFCHFSCRADHRSGTACRRRWPMPEDRPRTSRPRKSPASSGRGIGARIEPDRRGTTRGSPPLQRLLAAIRSRLIDDDGEPLGRGNRCRPTMVQPGSRPRRQRSSRLRQLLHERTIWLFLGH